MPKAAERPKFIKTTSVYGIYHCGHLWYSCKNHFSAVGVVKKKQQLMGEKRAEKLKIVSICYLERFPVKGEDIGIM